MEKINVAELLKDCPKGMKLDCTMYECVTLISVLDGLAYPIRIETPDGLVLLNEYGCYSRNEHAKCIIFPEGKTTWEGFQRPFRPFKNGDVVVTTLNNIAIIKTKEPIGTDYFAHIVLFNNGTLHTTAIKVCVARLATEEEKQKLFDAIKANGYQWNETKTSEKEEKKGKFDITTLKPFDSKVLVRHSDDIWNPAFWGFYKKYEYFKFHTTKGCYLQCIPYEGNEHLLGTTEDCDEYYKTWK